MPSIAGVNYNSVSLAWDAPVEGTPGQVAANLLSYQIWRATALAGPYTNIGTTAQAATTYIDNTVSPTTTYYYYTVSIDPSAEVSLASNTISATTPAPPVTVSITAPAAGTVSGTITVSATAAATSPDTISNVQFKLDGANLGALDSSSPYSIPWDTTTAANGSHTLTAVATDTSANSATSSGVAVTVANSGGSTPTLVSHVATGMANTPVATLTARFPDQGGVGAGNCLVCFVQYRANGSITSVKDNLGNSFSLATSYTSSSFNTNAACYVRPNSTAGVTYIQVTFSGLSTNSGGFGSGHPQMDISQWYNVATSSPVDVVTTSNSSKSLSMTTATGGDLILYWAIDLSDNGQGANFNGTSIAAGTGFTLLTADRQIGSVVQYQVQSAAGAVNPTCATSGTATWGSMAVALKSASSGSAPSATAMRIVNEYHCSFSGDNLGPVGANNGPLAVINNIQFPCQGNLLVGSYQAEGAITNITSTGNTWTLPSSVNITSSGTSQTSQIVYAANLIPSPNLIANFTFSGAMYGLIVLYDVVNASSNPFVVGAKAQGNNTTFASAAMPSLTPTAAPGIAFSMMCISWDTVNSSLLSGSILDAVSNNLESNNTGIAGTVASPLDEDAGIAHLYYSSTSAITFTYAANTAGEASGGNLGPGEWSSVVAAFLGVPTDTTPPGAPSVPALTVLSSTQIRVTMSTAATDNVDGPTALIYHVERRIGANAFSGVDYATFQGTVSPVIYTDNGCSPNTSYGYRVRASDTSGNLGPYATSAANVNTPAGAAAPLAFVQVNSSVPTNTGTITSVFTAAQTAGNTNVIIIGWSNPSALTITSVADTGNGAYTPGVALATNGAIQQAMYYKSNISAAGASGNTVTVILSGAAAFLDLRILEYSGIASTSPVDVIATNNNGGVASSTSAISITTINAHDVVVVGGTTTQSFNAVGTGFTRRAFPNGDVADDDIVSVAGIYTDASSQSASASWVMQAIAFKAIAPSTPTGLIVNTPTSASLNVNWTESTDANYTPSSLTYSLKRQASGGAFSVINPAVPGTGTGSVVYTDSGLSPNVLYGYQVQAIDPGGNTSVYTSTVSLSTSASSSVGWSEYEIVTAKSTYAATYTLASSGASWAAGIGTWYASVSTIRPTPSSLSSSLTSDRSRLRLKFSCLSGSTIPLLIAEGPSSIPASSASKNGIKAETVVRPSIGASGDATSTSADVANLRKVTEKTSVSVSASTSSTPVRLIRKSNPAALSVSLSVSKEVPRVTPLASTTGAISLSSSTEQAETRVVPVVTGASSSTANTKTTAYVRFATSGSSGSAGSVNPEALSRPTSIVASSSSSNSITTIVEIVFASSPSVTSAHQTLITAPFVTITSVSIAKSAIELFATGVAPKSLSASNSRSPPRATSHPNPSGSSSSAANVPPVRYITRAAINAAGTSGSVATAETAVPVAIALSFSNSSVIQRLYTRVPLGAISSTSTLLLIVAGSFVTASSTGSSSVNYRREQRPLPAIASGSSIRSVSEPLERQVIRCLSASLAASGNHNQLRVNNSPNSSSALFVLPEFGSTVRLITRPTSLSVALAHLNAVFLVSANSSSSAVTYTASHLFLASGSASSGVIIDHLIARPTPKVISASILVTYLPIRFPVSVASFSNTAMIPMVVETISSASNSVGAVTVRQCQEQVPRVNSASNGLIYAGIVTITSLASLSSGSVTARSVLRVTPKQASSSTSTLRQRVMARPVPKIISSGADSATTRLQGRYFPSASSSSNSAVLSVIASNFRSFPAVSSISTVEPVPGLNIPVLLNSASSAQGIVAFVETPIATSSSIVKTTTRAVQRTPASSTSGSSSLYPAVIVRQPKPVLATSSSGNATSRSAFRPQATCSSSVKAATNSKKVYSSRRTSSSSSVSVVGGKIIFRPDPISLSSSQATCARRAEARVTVNSVSLSIAIKAPEMRVIIRVPVNAYSSSVSSSNYEISFAILTAYYPSVNSFTNAMAVTRGLHSFAGGAINSSELEVVVISDFQDGVI